MKAWSKNFTLLSALVAWLLAIPAQAQFSKRDVGTSGAQFLKLPTSARAAAMGGAFVAVADDASALDHNPAGLARQERPGLAATHQELFGRFRFDRAAYVQPIGKGAIALGATVLTQDAINKVDNTGTATGDTLAPMDMSAKLGVARRFGALHLGLAAAFIRQSIDGDSAQTVALDAGVIYHHPENRFSIGTAVSSLGPSIGFKERAPLPTTIRAGAAYRPSRPITLALEARAPRDNQPSAHFGAEWAARGDTFSMSLQLGWESTRVAELGAMAGASTGIRLGLGPLSAAFSFSPFGDLGEALRVGIGFSFGTKDPEYIPRSSIKTERRRRFAQGNGWLY